MQARTTGSGAEAAPSPLVVSTQSLPPIFGHVCPQIFRSADPTTVVDSFAFLDTLRLKSVLLLSIEDPSRALVDFCTRNRVTMHHFGIEHRWPTPNLAGERVPRGAAFPSSLFLSPHELNSFSVLETIVKDCLELLLDVRNHPVLVTDTTGIFETGTLLGCLRKMQGWNLSSILVEYRAYAASRARSTNERFIEMFDTDLVTLPPLDHIPDWLLPSPNFYVDEPQRSATPGASESDGGSLSAGG
ncbi:protein-tyrosine-phosphatase [Malassezia sp. CBS 17886]|nr:protein-tyrosine-phosphatase [Malassezia sp. CBS 17886]